MVGQLTRSAGPEKLETVLDDVIEMASLPPQGPARRSLAGAEGTLRVIEATYPISSECILEIYIEPPTLSMNLIGIFENSKKIALKNWFITGSPALSTNNGATADFIRDSKNGPPYIVILAHLSELLKVGSVIPCMSNLFTDPFSTRCTLAGAAPIYVLVLACKLSPSWRLAGISMYSTILQIARKRGGVPPLTCLIKKDVDNLLKCLRGKFQCNGLSHRTHLIQASNRGQHLAPLTQALQPALQRFSMHI
ncbi:hypothetical protein HETIRDRAFT_429560 [Heterobasidion irregulare TC 32-1]|uniref:Uncharacterized protein n=1 Tax=Heterobasidion irregulare (strain TC 32-1) TaxID=747525 RepID=W4JWK3_HETIT|nr:uncharacterized protein HETIRDRAFT_429560 [Heterobasidion irregulare TC 32-1]ETW77261.1 hypothetical protein HETIRDRAFT_429560 [Heterobasidion irregulare TC 32-1]